MEKAIKRAIGGGKRNYMRKPQDWLKVASDESVTSLVSKDKTYYLKISPKDFKLVGEYRWYYKDGYAVTSINYKRVKMHHLILGKPPGGKVTDHINGDRMDNRRSNLRFVTSIQNSFNTRPVGVRKRGKSWEANICYKGRKEFKGSFKTKKEALEWRNYRKEQINKIIWI